MKVNRDGLGPMAACDVQESKAESKMPQEDRRKKKTEKHSNIYFISFTIRSLILN